MVDYMIFRYCSLWKLQETGYIPGTSSGQNLDIKNQSPFLKGASKGAVICHPKK